ncbi:aladin-like [Heptranchias perlo]|uniref:aladin-like n=1 Tax=Heptranchias perlo TaxID=212740 RepID=UPI00355AB3A6
MVWDPYGERLAVLLKGDHCSPVTVPMIAVFKTRICPVFELLPCGFVQSQVNSHPQFISFHPNFKKGALLTVGWSTGRISNIPFYFVSVQSYRPSTGYSPGPVCSSTSTSHDLFSDL